MKNYSPVIGLEIHVELKTHSKMFCQCSSDYFGKEQNTNTCPICLGLPGALPVPNRKAIEWTILIGKALGCKINLISKFDRKHYFYPDLPKGYQISQYDQPLAVSGHLKLKVKSQKSKDEGKFKEFRIHRVHLEEDTGKLLHQGNDTLVDFNRSGVPLVEIVTEPDFDNPDDVKQFLEELHAIIRSLGVSDADMEKGTMRLEPNISVRVITGSLLQSPNKFELPSYKVEVKNINSFRFVKQAIEYEVERQTEILEEDKTPAQETRGFDSKKQITYSQRSKEEAHDYRYFSEPDIPPLTFSKEYTDSITVPELPQEKLDRYVGLFGLKYEDAFILSRDTKTAVYFENVISDIKNKISKIKLKDQKFEQLVANLIINKKIAIDISLTNITKVLDLISIKETDTGGLSIAIDKILKANQKVVDDYKSGKQNALMFLVGQVMREMKGKADAKLVIQKIKDELT